MIRKDLYLFVCIFVAITIFAVGCAEKDYYDPTKVDGYISDTPSEFDFSTSQSVNLQLNYRIADGFVSTFDLYDENPLNGDGSLNPGLEPIAGGINVAGFSQLTRVIPSYVTELFLYSETLFVPTLSYAKIENGLASFESVSIPSTDTRAGNAGNFESNTIAHYLKQETDYYDATTGGNYKLDLIAPDFQKEVGVEILNAIKSTFKEGKIADEKYYKDATIKVLKGKDAQTGAEVFVSVLHSGAGWNNSLSYFVYEGNKELEDLETAEVEALEVINIFHYADVNTNTTGSKKDIGLTAGNYVQLLYKNSEGNLVKEFPVGAQIGWILHPNAFQGLLETNPSFTIKEPSYLSQHRLFSVSYWNSDNKITADGGRTNNYNIFFSATDANGDTFNCFGFEDQPNLNGDGDCNDVIFHVHTNPIDAIASPPSISEEDVETEEVKKGVLAFEDYWPEKGDYDLNDVVVKYHSTITYVYTVKKENGVTVGTTDPIVMKVKDKFSFIHTGAVYANAFSYKMDIPSSKISSIKITDEKTGIETDYTNSITVDGSGFIIDLCANVKDVITAMEYDTTPRDYTVVVEFKQGSDAILQDDFADLAAPYNPFITPDGNYEGAEVHLPMYAPTARVNKALFNTKDDRSDQIKSWYVSGENNRYPFAIHLNNAYDDFNVPKPEGSPINESYPRYDSWINSEMALDKDWYK